MKSFSRFLKENPIKHEGVVITWGRYNPPTVGHEAVFNRAAQVANSKRYKYRILFSASQDKKKNPLSVEEKRNFLIKLFPRYASYLKHNIRVKTIIQALQALETEFKNIVLIVGEDRVEEFQTLLNKYNGREYNFESIEVISAGDRDPDAEGIEGMSASKMRGFASQNNYEEFSKGLPSGTSKEIGKELFDSVRRGMQLTESLSFKRCKKREKFYKETFEKNETVLYKGKKAIIESVGSNYFILSNSKKRWRAWPIDVEKENA